VLARPPVLAGRPFTRPAGGLPSVQLRRVSSEPAAHAPLGANRVSATGAPTARAGDDSDLGEPVADATPAATTTAAGPGAAGGSRCAWRPVGQELRRNQLRRVAIQATWQVQHGCNNHCTGPAEHCPGRHRGRGRRVPYARPCSWCGSSGKVALRVLPAGWSPWRRTRGGDSNALSAVRGSLRRMLLSDPDAGLDAVADHGRHDRRSFAAMASDSGGPRPPGSPVRIARARCRPRPPGARRGRARAVGSGFFFWRPHSVVLPALRLRATKTLVAAFTRNTCRRAYVNRVKLWNHPSSRSAIRRRGLHVGSHAPGLPGRHGD
jgi:hypothetical protein